MNGKNKLKIAVLVLITMGLLSSAFGANAQAIVCDEPIPTGLAIKKTKELLGSLIDRVKDMHESVAGGAEYIQEIIKSLTRKGETETEPTESPICDFSLCQARVVDKGLTARINIDFFFSGPLPIEMKLPNCQPEECMGEPCFDLTESVEELRGFYNRIKGAREAVRDVLENKTVPVRVDLIKQGETAGDKITKPEESRRLLNLARSWLQPSLVSKNCVLNEKEIEKLEKGAEENIIKMPVVCGKAFLRGDYSPRIYSYECRNECAKEPTEECVECLSNESRFNPGTATPLAKINYIRFTMCEDACENGIFHGECAACLCHGKTYSECLDWFCGGSVNNYACCHNFSINPEIYQ